MKHQIHVSGLNLMSKCGVAFAYRHLQGMKSERSIKDWTAKSRRQQ